MRRLESNGVNRDTGSRQDRNLRRDLPGLVLLLQKHPERYRMLFLMECHYQNTEGFALHFLRGAKKYGIEIDDFYRSRLRAGVESVI